MKRIYHIGFFFLLVFLGSCKPQPLERLLPFSSVHNKLDGEGELTLRLRHPRIKGNIKKITVKENMIFLHPFWDIKGESTFGGGWVFGVEYFDSDYFEDTLQTVKKVKNYGREENMVISIFTRDHQEPFSCKIGMNEECGLAINVGVLDMQEGIRLWATDGEAVFTHLTSDEVGGLIRGHIKATDHKYFNMEMTFDAKIAEIDKR